MDFRSVVTTLNHLLVIKQPDVFNSSWIVKHAPRCYRFIRQNLRREFGGIDWDRLTYALDRKFQRRWTPAKIKQNPIPYEDRYEVATILKIYRSEMYVLIAPSNEQDRRTRDVIVVSFVRLAQKGNVLARQELMEFIRYIIDDWIERYDFLSRWRGYEEEIQKQVAGCIRRYRYTGSFLNYLFRTLECVGRGIQPMFACKADENKIELVCIGEQTRYFENERAETIDRST
jgi:hypothetical protein